MKTMKRACHRKNRKTRKWLAVLGAALLVLGLAACSTGGTAQPGREHRVSPEEMDFFKGQIQRNVGNLSQEELEAAAQDYITQVNAVYWLGSELGLCEPFDFGVLQQDWEDENAQRESKRQTGEVYYGPDTLTLDVYFPYQYSALQSDIVRTILDRRDEALVADARAFYQANPDMFTQVTAVDYEIIQGGETTRHTIPAEEFRFYGQSNPLLMDFLSAAQDGEETVLTAGETEYTVKRLGVTTELLDFEENERTIVEIFLNQERMGQWLAQIAAEHPVLF